MRVYDSKWISLSGVVHEDQLMRKTFLALLGLAFISAPIFIFQATLQTLAPSCKGLPGSTCIDTHTFFYPLAYQMSDWWGRDGVFNVILAAGIPVFCIGMVLLFIAVNQPWWSMRRSLR
jgi:hypothetical protein